MLHACQQLVYAGNVGVNFLGTSGKAGPRCTFQYSWSGRNDKTTAETSWTTSTGTQQIRVEPGAKQCFETMSYMDQATQEGTHELQVVFTNWVGFHVSQHEP